MPKSSNDKNGNGENGADDSGRVTEEDLRRDKYGPNGVDTSKDEDETEGEDESDEDGSDEAGEDDGKTDDEAQDEDSEDDSNDDSDDEDSDTFVKEFDNIKGDTLSDYARNLEIAYRNSSTEATKLLSRIKELEAKDTAVGDDDDSGDGDNKDAKAPVITDPTQLYMKQKMDEEIVAAYTEFSKDFNQVNDPAEYNKFTRTVAQLTNTILNSEKRMAPPRELYSKAAVILGWEPVEKKPTKDEKAGMALKDRAAVSKGQSGPKKPASKSKVTQSMIELNRKMYPGKTDAEIRTELEPFVQ